MQTQTFNHPTAFIAGWYWALPSCELKRSQVKPVTLLGKDLAIYRNADGKAIAIDAYCPHMGAHFAEGTVDGKGLRCFFHNWKFDEQGNCIDVPCLGKALPLQIKTWHTAERYGMIWVWVGKDIPQQPLPYVPELKYDECDALLGSRFLKNCHPNVVMINAIDAHHFNTVHKLPFEIIFDKQELNKNAITFRNTTRGGEKSWFIKLIRPLYKKEITYQMCYWYGSTGTVTVGPDFFHFHIMFALRLRENGKTEGQTILIAKKRSGLGGWLFNRAVLWLTKLVANYFAKGDTQVFQSIQFNLKTPTKADQSIVQFIQHVEGQEGLTWGSWETYSPPQSLEIRPPCLKVCTPNEIV
ncbi:aromatic ring-hydroxylating dioxygenase subunit alpha [Lusitaniella coriacea LEGE 07157]|uniref:Aromatic ring-hydroxylating dioxygenase subunit alpha n=1 Tax=Lusitaniella coriacea LEGE 07157 TaxID=945747 RepID=A0A8J7J6D9_9CYAN|nr:aromatic ring-hydroxylating dioxygenase subunit alpha [Lusitaniella coriacea]MBE9115570.1 aromatic ring-hydroxylating dioxygenase subunit alpha [Lusitaniella coriacea LEGE 07157]